METKNAPVPQPPINVDLSTQLHQNISLPNAIIYYLFQNSTSPIFYQTLLYSCKYFLFKFRHIQILHSLEYRQKSPKNVFFYKYHLTIPRFLKFNDIIKFGITKIWLTNKLIINRKINKSFISRLLTNVHRSDISELNLLKQNISFDEYNFLTDSGKIQILNFRHVTVTDENRAVVVLEKLIKNVPKAIKFIWTELPENSITTETALKLAEFSGFKNFEEFRLENVPETFNIEDYAKFVKKATQSIIPKTPGTYVIGINPNASHLFIERCSALSNNRDGFVFVSLVSPLQLLVEKRCLCYFTKLCTPISKQSEE